MNLLRRLGRHLSYGNVIATVALFAALGGSAYAATTINGNKIVKHSIGGGKLKNETITSTQIKQGSLNSSVINLSTLGTVPSAQTAVTATSASTANTATTAGSATTASSATTATTATTAIKATSAETADSATNADHASSADSATNADHADTAGDAETVDGETAADLTLACRDETEPFGGMCWDEQPRPLNTWVGAAIECAEEGGRLPTLGELVAYIAQPGVQAATDTWSSDIDELGAGEEEQAFTASESSRKVKPGRSFLGRFRCLFYPTNAP
jgi:hypothetical protein